MLTQREQHQRQDIINEVKAYVMGYIAYGITIVDNQTGVQIQDNLLEDIPLSSRRY